MRNAPPASAEILEESESQERAYDDIAGLAPRRQLELMSLTDEDLLREYRETTLDLDLACLCWSAAQDNPAVHALQRAFMGPNVSGLVQEQLALERLAALRGMPLTGSFNSLSGQLLH